MTDRPGTPIPPALTLFINGELSWRAACKELGLWDYGALLALLREHGLDHPLPARDGNAKVAEFTQRLEKAATGDGQ